MTNELAVNVHWVHLMSDKFHRKPISYITRATVRGAFDFVYKLCRVAFALCSAKEKIVGNFINIECMN